MTLHRSANVYVDHKCAIHNRTKRRCQVKCSATHPPHRIYAVSDLHTDYSENLRWLSSIGGSSHANDALIVAGDVCDDLDLLGETLSSLTKKFRRVYYQVGNHELWIRPSDTKAGIQTSLEKFDTIMKDICDPLGVVTRPERFRCSSADTFLWIVPLHSWHHSTFDTEPDIPHIPAASPLTIADYGACIWPHGMFSPTEEFRQDSLSSSQKMTTPTGYRNGDISLAKWFDSLNNTPEWDVLLQTRKRSDVITFSHFLPCQSLLPEKRFLYFPNLMKATGSTLLKQRIDVLQPDIHIFGHTHFAWDSTIKATRYIQAPLCSPQERRKRLRTICFDVFMDRAVDDPIAALWLPVEIYTSSSSSAAAAAGVTVQHEDIECPWAADGACGTVIGDRIQLKHGTMPPALQAHWSIYYEMNKREPEIVTMAPWVARVYERRKKRRV